MRQAQIAHLPMLFRRMGAGNSYARTYVSFTYVTHHTYETVSFR